MKTILLVEDNAPNMYLITFLLTKKGYNVFQAFNGEEGVRIALTEKLDLILMDIQLSGIDGYEAVKRIRASKAPRMPIVALTSFAMAEDKKKALNSGFTGYLTKPIDTETFVQEIEEYLPVEAV